MEEFLTRNCPHCCESIREGARKFAHCQSWLKGSMSWLSTSWFGNFFFLVLIAPLMWFSFRPLFHSNAEFSDYRDQIVITESKLHFDESDRAGTQVTILGRIQNNSSVKWEKPSFEVQCFDKDGNLVDTCTAIEREMILAPHTEQAFRIGFTPRPVQANYASHKVFLRDVRDAANRLY